MSALEERHQRADAVYFETLGTRSAEVAASRAIETATRVLIDDKIVQAYRPGTTPGSVVWTRTRARLVRAFEAAGFELTT